MASDLQKVRDAITYFCRESIKASGRWSYSQRRAYTGLGVHPSNSHINDCSSHATLAYFWAKKQTGIAVPDPNMPDYGPYDGFGWTGSLIDNPKTGGPYQVGDLALYGNGPGDTEHVCTCYVAGDSKSADWCSHGSEDGPYSVALHYRSDLIYVVRPVLVPGGTGEEDEVYDWLPDWLLWDLQGQYWSPPMKRPAAAPKTIPKDAQEVSKQVSQMLKRQGSDKCFEKWMAWKDAGEPAGKKPDCAPDKIYEEWQEARARMR